MSHLGFTVLAAAALWASCVHPTAAIAPQVSGPPASAGAPAWLRDLPVATPTEPRTAIERVVRESLAKDLSPKASCRVRTQPVVIASQEPVSSGILPPDAKAVLLPRSEIERFAAEHGSFEYLSVHWRIDPDSNLLRVDIGVSTAQAHGSLALCCCGVERVFRRGPSGWTIEEEWDYEV